MGCILLILVTCSSPVVVVIVDLVVVVGLEGIEGIIIIISNVVEKYEI